MQNLTLREAWYEDKFAAWRTGAPFGTRWFRLRWHPARGWQWDQEELMPEYLAQEKRRLALWQLARR